MVRGFVNVPGLPFVLIGRLTLRVAKCTHQEHAQILLRHIARFVRRLATALIALELVDNRRGVFVEVDYIGTPCTTWSTEVRIHSPKSRGARIADGVYN